MISPHGQHQRDLSHLARRLDHGPGPVRPAPRGSTVWWSVRAVAAAVIMVLGCAGLAGVMQSSSMRCHDVSHRTCVALVIDDLTRKRAD